MTAPPDRPDPKGGDERAGAGPGVLLAPDPFEVPPADEEAADLWIVTYMDVLTLLLTFFVVVVSYTGFARPERLDTVGGPERAGAEPGVAAGEAPGDDPLVRTATALTRRLGEGGLGTAAEVRLHRDHAGVEIEDRILFPSGRAEIGLRGREVLRILAPVLREADVRITVEGHTDDRPIATARFPSNWELSAARAAAVARLLAELGIDPDRLRAVGYADTRPRFPNEDPRQRARNRRVTLVLDPSPAGAHGPP